MKEAVTVIVINPQKDPPTPSLFKKCDAQGNVQRGNLSLAGFKNFKVGSVCEALQSGEP